MSEKEISTSGTPEPISADNDELENATAENAELEKPVNSLSGKLKNASREDILNAVLSAKEDELLPWGKTRLPSMGRYYGDKIPDGVVEVRPMGLHTDKILATPRLAQTGESLEHIFKHCVRLPNDFDPSNLLSNDRVFLLYYLRGITHGNEYEFAVNCTNDQCEALSTHMYNLVELYNTVTYPKTNDEEPFRVVLPYLSEIIGQEFWVEVRFMRGIDEKTMLQRNKIVRKVKGKGARQVISVDMRLEQHLNLLITSAMGDKDPQKIQSLIGKMHARDTATIREFLRNNTPGIDTSIDIECPECGDKMSIELPITESFFRPTKSGGSGERVGASDGAIVPT